MIQFSIFYGNRSRKKLILYYIGTYIMPVYKTDKWNDTTKIKFEINIKNKNTEKLNLRKW